MSIHRPWARRASFIGERIGSPNPTWLEALPEITTPSVSKVTQQSDQLIIRQYILQRRLKECEAGTLSDASRSSNVPVRPVTTFSRLLLDTDRDTDVFSKYSTVFASASSPVEAWLDIEYLSEILSSKRFVPAYKTWMDSRNSFLVATPNFPATPVCRGGPISDGGCSSSYFRGWDLRNFSRGDAASGPKHSKSPESYPSPKHISLQDHCRRKAAKTRTPPVASSKIAIGARTINQAGSSEPNKATASATKSDCLLSQQEQANVETRGANVSSWSAPQVSIASQMEFPTRSKPATRVRRDTGPVGRIDKVSKTTNESILNHNSSTGSIYTSQSLSNPQNSSYHAISAKTWASPFSNSNTQLDSHGGVSSRTSAPQSSSDPNMQPSKPAGKSLNDSIRTPLTLKKFSSLPASFYRKARNSLKGVAQRKSKTTTQEIESEVSKVNTEEVSANRSRSGSIALRMSNTIRPRRSEAPKRIAIGFPRSPRKARSVPSRFPEETTNEELCFQDNSDVPYAGKPFVFLDLPESVRLRIYQMCLTRQEAVVLRYSLVHLRKPLVDVNLSSGAKSFAGGLVRCCKAIHSEALPVLYGQNRFILQTRREGIDEFRNPIIPLVEKPCGKFVPVFPLYIARLVRNLSVAVIGTIVDLDDDETEHSRAHNVFKLITPIISTPRSTVTGDSLLGLGRPQTCSFAFPLIDVEKEGAIIFECCYGDAQFSDFRIQIPRKKHTVL
ncbi:hypothetical protein BGZ60DRAFT_531478 [Tricladium varicosporioides]|nr:hypothetical protein BGZ60DRAFT_531478 [Hymenoscyphus varicosporioides]